MSSTFWKSVLISPAIFGVALLLSTGAMAAPKTSNIQSGASQVKLQVNSPIAVNEPSAVEADETTATSDIKPEDWQYKALKGVATKYGCSTKLNDSPVSKIDFARGLNACLAKVEPLLAQQPVTPPPAPGAAPVTAEDLEVLKRLTQEFRAQLTEIDARLAQADKKIEAAQKNQFSTTTKLKGEAVFNVAGTISGGNPNNIIFGDRVRLLFESSFTGKDKLWTRIATGNQASLNSRFTVPTTNPPTVPSTTGAQVIDTNGTNTTSVDWLAYQFPFANTNVYVAAFNGLQADYAPTYSPLDDFTGASVGISSFGESSPIYKIGGGTGIGTTLPLSDTGITSLNVGYFAFNANNPTTGQGIFGSDNSILGQLNFKLSPQLEGGLTYVNSSHSAGALFGGAGVTVGTRRANNLPLVDTSTPNNPVNLAAPTGRTTANSYGLALSYKASDKLALNGFVMKSDATRGGVTDQIWSYGAGVALPDVDGKGGLAGLFVGAEPYVSGAGSTPIHIEGFYKYKLSDNLSITPGLIYLTATDETTNNSAVIGVIRTTFLF